MNGLTVVKTVLAKADTGLQAIGELAIRASELVGGAVLFPTTMNAAEVKIALGSSIIVGSGFISSSSSKVDSPNDGTRVVIVNGVAAMDIDRKGMPSIQAGKMKALGLLNKYGLWIPPEVGEAWHIEDPDTVYFRYDKRGTDVRKKYSEFVCDGYSGDEHHKRRSKDGIYTVKNSYRRVKATVEHLLEAKGIKGDTANLLKEYMLMTVRSESFFGKKMVSKTGALGWYQFTGPTAKQYKLKYPMQLKESSRAAIELALDNIDALRKNGIPVTKENIYFSHMIGHRGLKLARKAAQGKTLLSSDMDVLVKVVKPQLPKRIAVKHFDSKGRLTSGVGKMANDYFIFFNERFKVYEADIEYLNSI